MRALEEIALAVAANVWSAEGLDVTDVLDRAQLLR